MIARVGSVKSEEYCPFSEEKSAEKGKKYDTISYHVTVILFRVGKN